MTLRELFDKHGTDKGKLHQYDWAYEFFCGRLREKRQPIILEVGVHRGASIRAWREWFGEKAYIVGIDHQARYSDPLALPEATALFCGSQTDRMLLEKIAVAVGTPFDLVIDDGSHRPSKQLACFGCLWPYVAPGGVYVIEDVYDSKGFSAKPTPLSVTFDLAVRNVEHFGLERPPEMICYYGGAIFIVKVPGL